MTSRSEDPEATADIERDLKKVEDAREVEEFLDELDRRLWSKKMEAEGR